MSTSPAAFSYGITRETVLIPSMYTPDIALIHIQRTPCEMEDNLNVAPLSEVEKIINGGILVSRLLHAQY